MNKLITSINLSILALGISICEFLMSNSPLVLLPSFLTVYKQVLYGFFSIESIIAAGALFIAIKEKNRTAIILTSLLLIMFSEPFWGIIIANVYRNFLHL